MKLKKEYLILAVVIVALILYLALHRSDRTHYKLPQIPAISGKQISKLEITKAGQSVMLTKTDNTWHIEPKGYPADPVKIKNILNVIEKLKLTALVSESGNDIRYDLGTDKKIHVKAWEGNSLSREFDIGKAAPTFQHTFVRFSDDPNVYHARGDFRRKFDRTVDELRDRVVMSYAQKDISQITINREKQTFTFKREEITLPAAGEKNKTAEVSKAAKTKTVWKGTGNKKVGNAKINSILSFLNRLECESYIDDSKKEDFKNPICTVSLKGEKEYSLSIFAKNDKKDNNYSAVSSENDYPFSLSDSQVDDIQSKIDELLKEKEK